MYNGKASRGGKLQTNKVSNLSNAGPVWPGRIVLFFFLYISLLAPRPCGRNTRHARRSWAGSRCFGADQTRPNPVRCMLPLLACVGSWVGNKGASSLSPLPLGACVLVSRGSDRPHLLRGNPWPDRRQRRREQPMIAKKKKSAGVPKKTPPPPLLPSGSHRTETDKNGRWRPSAGQQVEAHTHTYIHTRTHTGAAHLAGNRPTKLLWVVGLPDVGMISKPPPAPLYPWGGGRPRPQFPPPLQPSAPPPVPTTSHITTYLPRQQVPAFLAQPTLSVSSYYVPT